MVNRVLTSPYLWWFDVFPLIGYVPRPLLKVRSEEHTSELQSQSNLVCRLLLEKKHNFRAQVLEQVHRRHGEVALLVPRPVPQVGRTARPRVLDAILRVDVVVHSVRILVEPRGY